MSHHEDVRADREVLSSSATDVFAAGEVFAGRYRMIAHLGQGGMGDVWSADDLVLGIPVALKLMRSTTPAGRALLLNEVRLARQITHPAVCRVFDIGEVDDQVFLSMELVQGEDLATFVHRVGRLPSEKVAEIGRQLCDALAAAHRQGILHRDLKPANVLIDETGSVRITDFGIAVTRGSGHNTGIGTPGYMAPEQLLSGASVSERTDLYALGLVLYELLVGRRTFAQAASVHHLAPPSTIVDGVDPRLERVVMRALSPDPADRPASAADMAAELAVKPAAGAASAGRFWMIAAAIASLVAIVAVVSPFLVRSGGKLTEQDTIVLADFMNTTG